MAAALLFALPASSLGSPPLPSVDLGVHALGFSGRSVSRRTDEDVWLVSTGAENTRVLRSSDAGRSWRVDEEAASALRQVILPGERDTVSILVWLSPEVGLAAGHLGSRVLRTTDAGRSWQAVALTDDPWVYDVERLGERVWLCGSSGRIFRSEDSGASWSELKGSPFNNVDRCRVMSFPTPKSGWAVGMNGSIWGTEDGGASWKRLPQPALARDGESPPGLDHLVRLSPRVAWVQGSGGRFITTDGGKSWSSRPRPKGEQHAALGVARTPDGRRIITVGRVSPGTPVEQWVPFLEDKAEVVTLGTDTVVELRKGVSVHVSGRWVRGGPPVGQGSGVLTPLEGFARRGREVWLGWAGDRIVASYDAGRSWFQAGRVPQSPVRALAFLNDDRVLAQARGGTLMRSEDLGRTWALSTSPLDADDFARASVRAMPSATPFDCVLTTSPASMTVRFSNQGCFHSYEGWLSVQLSDGGAEFSGEHAKRERQTLERTVLSRAEGEDIILALIEAATRQETLSDCGSTTSFTAELEWTCGSGSPARGKVSFRASDCTLPPGIEPPSGFDFSGYARAQGIHQVASQAVVGLRHEH